MEPCLFRHGKGGGAAPAGVPTPASMEPCLFRHGKGTYKSIRKEKTVWLQWSHVFSDMVSRVVDGGDRYEEEASMEPCLFRHGKIGIGMSKQKRIELLQWSHVFSDMVSKCDYGYEDEKALLLQWSHVFSDMVRRQLIG